MRTVPCRLLLPLLLLLPPLISCAITFSVEEPPLHPKGQAHRHHRRHNHGRGEPILTVMGENAASCWLYSDNLLAQLLFTLIPSALPIHLNSSLPFVPSNDLLRRHVSTVFCMPDCAIESPPTSHIRFRDSEIRTTTS